eukprot:gb/GECH01000773.1/.p1 GENE.gb/GECH01000773.1/~~gb/GECH01000773.1/.p1  ORF type:complete len:214 (+),score=67.95 gb/GECH01000773.1/:1-642(+)
MSSSLSCKIVIVGDGAVGKTCLLIVYVNNSFPEDYIPTVFDNYDTHVKYEDQVVKVGLWDTAGQEEYDRLRYLSYPHTDVFLVCFSVVNRISFENVEERWLGELEEHMDEPKPIILIGTKTDLRDDEEFVSQLDEGMGPPIKPDEGEKLAKKINAAKYLECSALKRDGVKEIFTEALRVRLEGGPTANTGGDGGDGGKDDDGSERRCCSCVLQ